MTTPKLTETQRSPWLLLHAQGWRGYGRCTQLRGSNAVAIASLGATLMLLDAGLWRMATPNEKFDAVYRFNRGESAARHYAVHEDWRNEIDSFDAGRAALKGEKS